MLIRLGNTTRSCIRHPQEFHLCSRPSDGRHLAQSSQGVEVMGLGNRQAEGKEVRFYLCIENGAYCLESGRTSGGESRVQLKCMTPVRVPVSGVYVCIVQAYV